MERCKNKSYTSYLTRINDFLAEDGYLSCKKIEYLCRYSKKVIARSSSAEALQLILFFMKNIDRKLLKKISTGDELEQAMQSERDLRDSLEKSPYMQEELLEAFQEQCLRAVQPEIRQRERGSVFFSRLSEMGNTFKLTPEESELLTVLYLLENDNDFEEIFSDYEQSNNGKRMISLCQITGFKRTSLLSMLNKKSTLNKYALIDEFLSLKYYTAEYLHGLGDKLIETNYFTEFNGKTLPLKNFVAFQEKIEIIRSIIQNKNKDEAVNILLYGRPGTGKTELARALGNSLGMKIYEITHVNTERMEATFRFAALNACRNITCPENSLIIIDEADDMLNGSTGKMFDSERNAEKGLINDALDNSSHTCIWITNTSLYIDESTRRRFDYSLEFAPPSKECRKHIWKNSLLKHEMSNILSEKDIDLLSAKYRISAGGINIALKNCSKIAASKRKDEILEGIENILNSHQKIMAMERQNNNSCGCENYSLEGLSVKSSLPLEKLIDITRNFYSKQDTFSANKTLKNINILLHGPPGTGKTEFARHLAETLEKPLITKRGSDLLDKFLGGTEQNIRDSFREAESENAILFIDEVDGLIVDRGYATRSWEVTQVNELLGQMEDFNGILLCATNSKNRMDSASIRRFGIKVEFDWLDSKGKVLFFNKLLGNLSKRALSQNEEQQLKAINNLTPGDYKLVLQRFSFQEEDTIQNTDLINALAEEAASKNNTPLPKIGF